MKIRLAVPVFAALALASLSLAQAAPTPADAGGKVAVMSVQGAIANTAEGKEASARLQSQFAPQQAEMQKIQKDIEDLNTRLRTGATTLSDEEKARIQQQIDTLTRTGQRKQQEFQDDTNAAEQDVINGIGRKLEEVVDKYAKDNGYSVILDVNSQQTTVFWAADSVNITQQIISLYDATYPMKSGGASSTPKPSAPSAPKPSTAPKPQ